MTRAVRVEWLKLRRSRVTLVATSLMGLLLPAMGLGFYEVATTGGVGGLADKASALLLGEGWVGYLGLVDQIAAVAVFLGAGVVVAWGFGREYADRTFPSLFALPVSRAQIASAKFTVLAIWVVGLSLLVTLVALALGVASGIGPIELGVIAPEVWRLATISLLAGTLALSIAYAASVGRGYLPAIGALVVIIAVSQVVVLFGTGGWLPFAVPGLMAVSAAEGVPSLNPVQIALVPLLALATILATMRWWRRAEVSPS